MKIKLLKSKIHRATVTDACLDYEGSISIDQTLLKASNILPYESVQVLNEKGEICINGAAAHLVNPKDIVIIVSYVHMTVDEAKSFKPSLVYPNEANEI